MTTRKPATPRGKRKPRAPKATPARHTPAELAELSPVGFARAMLEQVAEDIAAARAKGSMSSIGMLTAHALRLRRELAELESEAHTEALTYRSSDELVEELVEAVAKLPDAIFERVEAAVQQRRNGRPRMRVV